MLRICLLLLLAMPAAAQTPVLLALRANNWPLAATLAASSPDPLAPKLVTFIRLLNPGQASAGELAAFIAANPTWPDQPALEHRYAEAVALEPDARQAATLCRAHRPQSAPGLLRCADAYGQVADLASASTAARAAWVTGLPDPPDEAAFLARWAGALTLADQQARFTRLLGTDSVAAQRQLARLPTPARALGAALLAFRQNAPAAMATLAAVPPGLHADPALLLAEARYLRRGQADQAALALWNTVLPEAEAAAAPARRAAFWTERESLARRLVATDPAAAYVLADDATLGPDQAVEADFLAGWIALQRLHDPARARAKFQALASISHAAITQARAGYWLARATPDPAGARASFAKAAAWPLTYYGQLAAQAAGVGAAALHQAIAAAHDLAPSPAEQAAFAASEPARAATILAGWQDPRRGADFLAADIQPPASLATRAMVAALALRLGLPDVAVQAARLAGRDGTVLPQAGWPTPVQPPAGPLPAPLALAIMRQESSFDPAIVSPAGAHGLMQLMPATAQSLARAQHVAAGPLADPAVNMRLGTAYLAGLLDRFGGCLPCAVAAYNAGPNRVADWIAANGNPGSATSSDQAVDWVEMIPFNETRNYVQRVLENREVYEAK